MTGETMKRFERIAVVAKRDSPEAGSAGKGLRIESAGPPEGTADQLEIPIRLVDDATGRELSLRLKLSLDEA